MTQTRHDHRDTLHDSASIIIVRLAYASLITDATLHMPINAHCGCIDAINNVAVQRTRLLYLRNINREKSR